MCNTVRMPYKQRTRIWWGILVHCECWTFHRAMLLGSFWPLVFPSQPVKRLAAWTVYVLRTKSSFKFDGPLNIMQNGFLCTWHFSNNTKLSFHHQTPSISVSRPRPCKCSLPPWGLSPQAPEITFIVQYKGLYGVFGPFYVEGSYTVARNSLAQCSPPNDTQETSSMSIISQAPRQFL